MVVTQQYLIGELSLLLASVVAAAKTRTCVDEAVRLRRLAETSSLRELPAIAVRAIHLTNALCWASLSHGDLAAFNDQAELAGRLLEFAVCSDLIDIEDC